MLLRLAIGTLFLIGISYGWVSWMSPTFGTSHHQPPTHATTTLLKNTRLILRKPHPLLKSNNDNQRRSYRSLSISFQIMSSASDNNSLDDISSDDNNQNQDSTSSDNDTNGIDLSFDPRLYKVRLSRATGIE